MKKIFLGIILGFILMNFPQVEAYDFSQSEQQNLLKIKEELYFQVSQSELADFEKYQKNIDKKILKNKSNRKIWAFLLEIKNELLKIQYENFPETNKENSSQEEAIVLESSEFKKTFFENHGKNITTKLEIPERCSEFYKEIDDIARENNFPTALIIATWWKESNCGLANPKNGWGPFQITSTYHTPGTLTFEQFEQKVIQYIEFSRGKINSYEKNKTLKNRFGIEKINISYNDFSLSDLQLYAVLYNGAGKTTDITKNTFANANLNQSITSNSDGLITRFLKIIYYETQR